MQSVECQTILFLCTGNSCRSQMAEGFGRALAPVGFEILSAGTEPRGIHPKAIQVMAEMGIDIGSQNSQGLEGIDLGGLGLGGNSLRLGRPAMPISARFRVQGALALARPGGGRGGRGRGHGRLPHGTGYDSPEGRGADGGAKVLAERL